MRKPNSIVVYNLYIVFGKAYGASFETRERLVYPRSDIIDKFLGRTNQNEFRFPHDFSFLHINRQVNKQLLDEVEHDIMNYQNRGLCYLPKPKAEADNTDTRF